MFDIGAVESLSPEHQQMARQALMLLNSSGLIEAQQQANFARLAAGSVSESEDDLFERIRWYRYNNGLLETLRDLGEELKNSGD